MKVPMVDLAARHRRLAEEAEAQTLRVLRSGGYIGGPEVQAFCSEVAQSLSCRHAVGVGSGTEALILSLKALGIGPGHRVLVPALSFFASVESILYVGAEPVFADTLPDRPLLDPQACDTEVDAAMLVHLYGAKSPAPDLKPGTPVISDAAQCAGWGHGRPEGDLVALSLYPTKTLGVCGDGGMVLGEDPALIERVRLLGVHGQRESYGHWRVEGALGTSSRLDAVQAALGRVHLRDLERRVRRRRELADRYDRELASHQPLPREEGDAVHQYVIRPADRERVKARLTEAGIGWSIYYPYPQDAQPAITGADRPDLSLSRCPNAVAFCQRALAIPVHAELQEEQIEHLLETLHRL